MSAHYDAARIRKPSWFKVGPLRRGRPMREPYVIGFDSEADKSGAPFLYQFAHPDGHVDLIDVPRRRHESFKLFLRYLFENCKSKKAEYIVYGFNLQYEYTQIFRDIPSEAHAEKEFVLAGVADGIPYTLRALNDKRYSFTIEFGGTKRRIKVIDAFAFITTSLAEAAKIVGATPKLGKPKRFGPHGRHDADFIAYAEADARATQEIGEFITRLHETYDVATCVTAPQFATRTFRRHYLNGDVPPLDEDIEQIGLDSYHGGKNGYYLDRPRFFRKVWNVDIRSAYPEAMRQIPCIEHGEWSLHYDYVPGIHAVYVVALRNGDCRYHPVYRNDGTRAPSGAVESVTITSYELDSALAHGCAEIAKIERVYELTADCNEPTALQRYVDDFYQMKRAAPTTAERNTAKLFLNSLYGKFFQKVPLGIVGSWDLETGEYTFTDPEADFDYEAGGLYHPPIASLITGFVRGKIHTLEHRYGSVMTSTDGFFALTPPNASDLGAELGMLDSQIGELRIWRERLYVFKPRGGGKLKYALHGFRAGVEALLRIPLRLGHFEYLGRAHPLTLKEAQRQYRGVSYGPGEFVELTYALTIARASKTGLTAANAPP